MRIWDIDPGYLNHQSLLGEHRELHGIVSIIVNGKKGYSQHPETLRWVGHGWALRQRHKHLACEMALRGFSHQSPVTMRSNKGTWPANYLDQPGRQFQLLQQKYLDKEQGRIPLPNSEQQLWSHHKYSVLARDVKAYQEIGRRIAQAKGDFAELALLLTESLRKPPTKGGVRNAVQHMWGYVSDDSVQPGAKVNTWSLRRLLQETQERAIASGNRYLTHSTALAELMAWLPAAR